MPSRSKTVTPPSSATPAGRPPVYVREVVSSDRARWHELWRGYLEFYRQTLPAEVTDLTWQRLIDPAYPLHGLVAEDDSRQVIGFVHHHTHLSTWSIKGYCYLEDLFVDPACRTRGAGRALIEAVYRAADESGASRVYWHTENTNARAQLLYNEVAELTSFVQYRRRK